MPKRLLNIVIGSIFSALSLTAWVQAPVGSLVMTGSDPPDISAATVTLPSGEVLEAHSGLGVAQDNPDHVHIRMRGATPPHVYDLSMREALFHGVEAIRLNPVGGSDAIHGRTGLLAHTYMLGPRGDSNGCVSFKDYDAFLRAFKRQQIKRLAVVASLD